ncbi:Uncharacterized protein FWK35_00014878 [Aphis craccivora]|uniref:Uncharacterized protein n=1 Tax=Aphis craccivora TaxID=307492 RepID=A0A6G0YHE1_APHCR|nr:Uncharacterized protein FWK35_00014878 [Aphis craccivora]
MLQFQISGGDFRWKCKYPCCIIKVNSKQFLTVFKENEKNKKKNNGNFRFFFKYFFLDSEGSDECIDFTMIFD